MVDCIIQARMGSSRLPGKVMMKIDSKNSVLDLIINQLKYSKFLENIIIATTSKTEDDVIEKFCLKNSLRCFRGSEKDVLDRYYQCSKKFNLKHIIRITADCPLIDPEIVDKVIEKYKVGQFDYFTNILIRTFPIGTDVEIFSFETLEKMWKDAKLPSEREHVTTYIRNKKLDCKFGNLENVEKLGNLRFTLDRYEDLQLIKKITSKIHKNPILIKDVIKIVTDYPELLEINKNVENDEGMKKSLKIDSEYLNKKIT
tara:strand:- start:385 stop:1155 length:771 start_codon:yes stop_codon:yes gene_type:complete